MQRRNIKAGEIEINAGSVELLRDAAQNEYSNEHERTTTMDAKAGIALPIISAYFLALAQMNDYRSINVIPKSIDLDTSMQILESFCMSNADVRKSKDTQSAGGVATIERKKIKSVDE